MKNLLKSLIFAAVFMLSTCGIVKADSNISLNRVQSGSHSIEVSIDDVDKIVNSFQVSLKIEGSAKLTDIEWNDNIRKNAKADFKYNVNDNVVDIYVTSKHNLVNKNGQLQIGTFKMEGPVKGDFNIVPNTGKPSGALKLISNNYKKTVISQMDIKGQSSFTFSDNSVSGDTDKPGDSNTGNTDKPGDNNSGSTDKPGDSNIGNTDKPGDNNSGNAGKPEDSNTGNITKPGDSNTGSTDKPGDNNSGNIDTPDDNNSEEDSKKEDSSNENTGNDESDKDKSEDGGFEDVENEILCGEDHDHSQDMKYNNLTKEGDDSKFVVYGGLIAASLLVIAGVFIVSKKMKQV